MKTTKLFFMAALALMTAACSNDDNDLTTQQPQKAEGITITAQLAPKTNGATTRAVEDKTTYIETKWAVNEHIAILYEVSSTKYVADATITAVDGSGTATISFTVEAGTANDTPCTLVYPLSAAKDDHTGVKDVATLLAAQNGTLNANLDVRVGEGTIQTTTPGLTVTTQPAAQFAIFKFTTKNSGGTATIDVKPLTITIGAQDYVITPASATSELYVALPAVSGQTVSFSATGSDSKTYTCSKDGVTFTTGKYYQSTLTMAKAVPEGAINGRFSVSDTRKVYFSKGNLQATYNTSWSWAFAANQWDCIGNSAGNTSINGGGTISGTGTVDLFGWVGAACEWTGAAQYGISNVTQAAQYGNVEGEALKSDWGTLAITNGGNTANFGWHSLASSEWEYLFKTRTTPSGVRYAHATVNDVPGLVLLPDDWSTDYYSLNKVNDANSTAYTDNVISSSDWTSKLEAHGAVFLPAGGYRNGAEVSEAGVQGTYWSSTSSTNSGQQALCFFFKSAKFAGITSGYMRSRGCSVRLVYDAN